MSRNLMTRESRKAGLNMWEIYIPEESSVEDGDKSVLVL